ncbi:MAG TPA: hypothetical protein PK588_11085 [Paludibacteraceae bacterium]|nr:hypothetical protein [Paludibacteraceae bacterium]HQF51293.1 hypothetical protein [Paludibacteraceae bacterium]
MSDKLNHLIFLYKEVKEERDDLAKRLEEIQRQLSESQLAMKQHEKDYQNLKLAKVISVSEEESKSTKHRLSRLEREIEKCIALLNE